MVLLLALPSAVAYGTLDAVNGAGPTLAPIVESELRFFLYGGVYAAAPADAPRLRVSYSADRETWGVYQDQPHAGRRNNVQDADEPTLAAIVFPRVHGNLTDHALVVLPGDVSFRLCTDRAQDGLAEGAGLGLRCGGDVDEDGEGDVSEIVAGSDPVGGG